MARISGSHSFRPAVPLFPFERSINQDHSARSIKASAKYLDRKIFPNIGEDYPAIRAHGSFPNCSGFLLRSNHQMSVPKASNSTQMPITTFR